MTQNRPDELTSKSVKFYDYKVNYFNSKPNNNAIKIMNYFGIDLELWYSYKWQMSHKISSIEIINNIFSVNLNCELDNYFWEVTPYYLSLMKSVNYNDPVFSQVIPNKLEDNDDWGELDPMDEVNMQPVKRITRRYPDRLIINTTNMCFSYCRYCQRKRNFSNFQEVINDEELNKIIIYLNKHKEIRDVLITGGDPLTLSDEKLFNIISKIRSVQHIEVIRIGTRALCFLPQRITDSFVNKLKLYQPIYINTQFNHPNEISELTIKACNLIANNGIILGNQSVLLKGINDNVFDIQLLNQLLIKNRIRPYYIFHPKQISGTHHFYVELQRGLDIMNELRGNTSGMCIPTYVINSPGGFGKVPLSKNLIKFNSKNEIELTTWENKKIIIKDNYEI